MPRTRVYNKFKNWNKVVSRKNRIGTRSNGVPAAQMKTKDLIAILASTNKAKWHSRAAKVLQYRGNLQVV